MRFERAPRGRDPSRLHREERPGPRSVASTLAATAGIFLVGAIYLGSRGLRNFDSALVGYAVAIVFLTFGVVYRYAVWVQSPPARRYLIRGWRAFLSWRNFLRFPALVPRALISHLSFQTFIRERGRARWLAHQAVFWGVILATLITFPLVFGWIHFRALPGERVRYVLFVWGFRAFTFEPLSWFGWLVFHGLDVSAVLVLAGCGYFIWRRFRDREASTGQRLGYDFIPLLALVAISVTGLLLTFSSLLLDGRGYEFLAIIHMATVVLTLVFIPFGKFFHVIQRPAQVGVEVFKRTSAERSGVFLCRHCRAPLETTGFVTNLQETMQELGLPFAEWVETCPRCKRHRRGEAYLAQVKRGFVR
ncbi:MAG TPA: MFS transporter [Actinomycetota bacterium]|nr:MFS transporter [Actinomycetota bacterium]